MNKMLSLGLGLALLAACNQPAPPAATPAAAPTAQPAAAPPAAVPPAAAAPAQAAGAAHFGAPLSDAAAIPVSTVLAEPAKFNGKTVKISGQVGAVCQKKGCWMTLGSGQPGEPTMRVSFKDYGFFVPRESLGRQATVEGDFAVTTLSVAQAQHLAEDAVRDGEKAQTVKQPQQTLAMVASGVDLR